MGHKDRTETLEVMVRGCTDKAVRVSKPGEREEFWIPFSQIIEPDEQTIRECEGTDCELEIPNWLAEERGLL